MSKHLRDYNTFRGREVTRPQARKLEVVIACTEPVCEHEPPHLEINISTELGISAQKAKRKVTRYLMDHVSLFLMPANPLLVLLTENEIVWRFPLCLALVLC